MGRADEQARQQMANWWRNVVLHERVQSGLDGLVLHVDAAWSDHVTAVCTPPTPQAYPRRAYRLDARGSNWAGRPPAALRLRLVDAALLADRRIQNLAYLTEEMVSERPLRLMPP